MISKPLTMVSNKSLSEMKLPPIWKTTAHVLHRPTERTGYPNLEYRKLRSHLNPVYKILNGIDAVEKEMLFPINNLNQHNTRGHKQII